MDKFAIDITKSKSQLIKFRTKKKLSSYTKSRQVRTSLRNTNMNVNFIAYVI